MVDVVANHMVRGPLQLTSRIWFISVLTMSNIRAMMERVAQSITVCLNRSVPKTTSTRSVSFKTMKIRLRLRIAG